jgi:hypothetical protein
MFSLHQHRKPSSDSIQFPPQGAAMRIRRICNVSFRRNIPFWVGRQARGEEIHLMQMGKIVGILYGDPIPSALEYGVSMLKRGNRVIWKSNWERHV